MCNYWITTHWPPEIDEQPYVGIFLYDGSQQVGTDIKVGDRVWIYQSKTGRRIVREKPDGSKYKNKRKEGKEGVVALMEVVSELHESREKPEKYENGTERWWRWKADTRLINQSGFVPRIELNKIMNYKSNFHYRGFGDNHSGLKKISSDIHEKILQSFNKNQPSETKPVTKKPIYYNKKGHGKGGEGPDHKKLKLDVAKNPEQLLGEKGLSLIKIEYPFITGDRIDILLRDSENRYVAVEIEVTVDLDDISGVLQAIKYSRMCAVECRRKFEEVRAFLVAHNISDDVKELCQKYDIETFVVNNNYQ